MAICFCVDYHVRMLAEGGDPTHRNLVTGRPLVLVQLGVSTWTLGTAPSCHYCLSFSFMKPKAFGDSEIDI